MKRSTALLCAGILVMQAFAGCGGSSDKKDSSAKTEDNEERSKK